MRSGWTVRLGEACVLSLGVATFTAIPTALRTAAAGGSFVGGLLVGAAILLLPLTITLLLVRAAGRGFRGVVGATPRRVVVLGIALWMGLSMPALALFGRVLKANTHHRGLAGAVFAVGAVIVVALAAAAAHRIVMVGQNLVERGTKPWIPAAVGAAIAVVPLLVMAAPLAGRGGGPDAPEVRAAIVDAAIALVATALVASVQLDSSLGKLAGMLGVPLAAIVVIAGAARIESAPPLVAAVRAGGGLAATLLGALEGWTDRDADGVGAHFGGTDCDEGDPSRHPGAAELPGDGIDQDCDGEDPPRPPPAAHPRKAPALGSTVPASTKTARHEDPRPDIVLVTLDTVRADHTSAYGYAKETTPKLAELAQRGMLFEHAYATASDTQRALLPLVSGRRLSETPHDAREWPTILPEVDTLAERLKRAGYATAAVTSFTWLSDERGFAQGFDRFQPVYGEAHPERAITGDRATASAKAQLAELQAGDKPAFLWVHYFDAHERYLPHSGIDFGKGTEAAYDGEIAFVDRQLGELVASATPDRRIAWIVHGSHGEAFGEHGTEGHGLELYDEVLRVPLVISFSDAKSGRYGDGAVSTIDLPATVLDLAGASTDGLEGTSLLPFVRGDAAARRAPVYARSSRRAAVIDFPLKLVVLERKKKDRLLLFDLSADPAETRDLADERPDDVQRLDPAKGALSPKEK